MYFWSGESTIIMHEHIYIALITWSNIGHEWEATLYGTHLQHMHDNDYQTLVTSVCTYHRLKGKNNGRS